MSQVQSSDALSVIGFFLTLVALLGSFFYIHLSDWYRDVLALVTKWRLNRYGDDPDQKAGRRECRYEVEKVTSWTMLITTLVVTGFVIFVFLLSAILWLAERHRSDAWAYIGIAGVGFLLVYLGMTFSLLIAGYYKVTRVRDDIKSQVPLAKGR
jgi:MFS family permease